MPPSFPPRPTDATLSVTKAARLLGVHPNTIRTWSDAGRLRYFRINARGDRRYRLGDLQRFLASAAPPTPVGGGPRALPGSAAGDGTPSAADVVAAVTRARDGGVDPLATERHQLDLSVATTLARLASQANDPVETFEAAAGAIRDTYGHRHVSIWELQADRLRPTAVAVADDAAKPRLTDLPRSFGILGAALGIGDGRARRRRAGARRPARRRARHDHAARRARRPAGAGHRDPRPGRTVGRPADRRRDGRLARCARPGRRASLRRRPRRAGQRHPAGRRDRPPAPPRRGAPPGRQRHRQPPRPRPDPDRPGRPRDGPVRRRRGRGLRAAQRRHDRRGSQSRAVEHLSSTASARSPPVRSRRPPSKPTDRSSRSAIATIRAARTSARRSSRRASTRSARRRFATAATVLGLLNVYHDRPHPWTDAELETHRRARDQAGVAIRAAQDYDRMATWAAQLQSIQQLGTRLNRLSGVTEIGLAIANELRQLIDYHNVRVYRLDGQELVPVAMQGQVGEYVDETPDQLRVTLGEGITGWVAVNRIAQNLGDAAADPRAEHDSRDRGGPRRVDAPRPDAVRRPGPGRARPVEARPQPVQRRRPAAARDLRQLRRPGHGQRRRDGAPPGPEPGPGAPAPRPARAPPDHRVDPDHARRPRRARRASPSGWAA